MKFSVLMSVYFKEDPFYLYKAIESIYDKQTVKPDEVVIVKDGPLTKDLDEVIAFWKEKLGDVFQIVSLKKNVGLSEALKQGIHACRYEWIARMDTDDIAMPERFEKQLQVIRRNPDIDLVGSWIAEFEDHQSNIYAYRKLPVATREIKQFAKYRCPVNHMTVMYKKSKVLEAGSYDGFKGIEDYFLWAKMLNNGAKFINIPEYLVHVRAGRALSRRRGGWNYAKMEFLLQVSFVRIGFIDFKTFIKNTLIRFVLRMIPHNMREKLYRVSRKTPFYKVRSDRNIYFDLKCEK